MIFNSFTYLFFLLVTVLLRWILPRQALLPLLLFASYLFYAAWHPAYLPLLAGITLWSFLLGLAVERPAPGSRLLLWIGIAAHLGALAYFKYAAFLAEPLYRLRLLIWGLGSPPLPSIVLPLGVSFLTLQILGYLIDVYRGQPAERSFIRYALFVSFFPYRASGPIARGSEFLPQLREAPSFDAGRFAAGLDRIALGFIKKICFADNLAKWSDTVFSDPAKPGTWAVWVGAIAYTGQIYCDFSGYTDIARGSARLLGFELPENFRLPYLSRSVTEFWRRWHMTLSFWMRDYLYIPLGGNRRGRLRRCLNLVLTMGLGGLWHGASLGFVVWGLYHGVLLLLHKALLALWARSETLKPIPELWPYRIFATLSTLLLVCLGWVIFRAPDLGSGMRFYAAMFRWRATAELPREMAMALVLLGLLSAGHLLAGIRPVRAMAARLPIPARGAAWALGVAACYLMAGAGPEFIYNAF